MLQQTTVKAVIPYYERFLDRFPTIESLAAAEEAEVLKLWEGLGYYSRGRNLHRAARNVCERFRGEFPRDLSEIESLPGIGRYTAGAIRSFAFDLPAPIVEANTARLYCRLLGYDGDPTSREGQQQFWALAERLQPARKAAEVNQSLMDLGATVCTPSDPGCSECPLREHCIAFLEGRQQEIPRKKTRPTVTRVVEATVAVRWRHGSSPASRSEDRYLLRQLDPGERWAGMWDFPRFPLDGLEFETALTKRKLAGLRTEIVTGLQARVSKLAKVVDPRSFDVGQEIRHSVTRYRIRLICLTAELLTEGTSDEPGEESTQWATLEEIQHLAMPITGRRFAKTLLAGTEG